MWKCTKTGHNYSHKKSKPAQQAETITSVQMGVDLGTDCAQESYAQGGQTRASDPLELEL